MIKSNIWLLIIVIFVAAQKSPTYNTVLGQEKAASRFAPKTEHEREVLRSVADRIYATLKAAQTQEPRGQRGYISSEDAGDMLSSVLSMVMDRDGRAPLVESEARVLETLSHFIAEESERLRKRQDIAFVSPNVSSELMQNNRRSFLDMIKSKFGLTPSIPKTIPSNKVPPSKSFDEVVGIFRKNPVDGKDVRYDSNVQLEIIPEAKMDPAKDASKLVPKAVFTSNSLVATAEPEQEDVSPSSGDVLKLTPHVVFTDAEGREYRLIGVGGRDGSDCSKQCLGTENGSSKNVLAFRKPTSREFLVLADIDGSQLFTSGVQMCSEDANDSRDEHLRAPDLSLLHPNKKRGANHKKRADLSVKWKENLVKPMKKRESKSSRDDFTQDVDALYNGIGLSEKLETKPKMVPKEALKAVELQDKKSRRKRQKQVSVLRSRRDKNRHSHKFDKNRNTRLSYADVVGADEESTRDESRNPIQTKLLSDLERFNSNLEEYSKGGKAKIDVDRCKRHCDDMGAHIDRLADAEDALESARSKRSAHFDLMPSENVEPSENGSCVDCVPKEFLSLDPIDLGHSVSSNGYKIITLDDVKKTTEDDINNPPLSDEEFNMILPTMAPDEEDKILLQTIGPRSTALSPVSSFGFEKDDTAEPLHVDKESSLEEVYEERNNIVADKDEGRVGHDSGVMASVDNDMEWAVVPPDDTATPDLEVNTQAQSISNEWMPGDVPVKLPQEPINDDIAGQIGENVKDRVENSPEMNRVLAPALEILPPVIFKSIFPTPQYSSAFDVLVKTFMLNVEKLAEDELAGRNCVKLTTEMQNYLAHLLSLPVHVQQVDQYHENVQHVPSFEELAIRKNKLVSLLKEFGQMSQQEQAETLGVKSFIESELHSIEKQESSPPTLVKDKHRRSFGNRAIEEEHPLSRKMKQYEKTAKKWFETMKNSVDLEAMNKLNVFRAKAFSEVNQIISLIMMRRGIRIRRLVDKYRLLSVPHFEMAEPRKFIGRHTDMLPTPALVVSLPKVKNNCKVMLKKCSDLGIRMRPHVKTHKTIEAALIQTDGRREGIVVSTLAEAFYFAQNGFDDIVIGRPVTRNLLQRCHALLAKNIQFLVNSAEGALALIETATEDNPLRALLKISGGYERAGILWNDKATIIDLACQLNNSPFVNFLGLYAHCGNSYTTERSSVQQVRNETVERLIQVKSILAENGVVCDHVGIGSTPSCSLATSQAMAQLTELHAGNYVFYDIQQESYGACQRDDIAVRVVTRVVSHHPSTNKIIVDLGFTALTKQGLDLAVPGYAAIVGYPEFKLSAMTQELGKVEKIDGTAIDYNEFPVDKPLYLLPYHACATAGVHPHYYVHDEDDIVCDIWQPVKGW